MMRFIQNSTIKTKFIGLFVLTAIVLISIIGHCYYVAVKKEVFEIYGNQVNQAVQLSAMCLDGDELLGYLEKKKIDDNFKWDEQALKKIKKMFGLKYLDILKPEDDCYVYVYSTHIQGDDEANVPIGTKEEYIDGNAKIMHVMKTGEPTQTLDIYESEKYGKLASAYAPVLDKNGKPVLIVSGDYPMQEIIDQVIYTALIGVGKMTLAIIVIIFICNLIITKDIVNPIMFLTDKVKLVMDSCYNGTIAEKDFDFSRELRSTKNEIVILDDSFGNMTSNLQSFIINLKKVTSEKQKIETELDVARNIQLMLLPKVFPPFSDSDTYSIRALIEPARSVGGDFYDFYRIDDDHIGFTIADVSGKGVPAALFMVISKTIMKNLALCNVDFNPSEIISGTNDQLSETNEEGMFVTAFFGIYQISTGKIRFANAGHNVPLIYRHNGSYEYMQIESNVVLAAMDGMDFEIEETYLEPGDKLFMYTDGVTEEMNEDGQVYSEQKLEEVLNGLKDKNLSNEEIISSVRESIRKHSGSAEQSDDITMMILERLA